MRRPVSNICQAKVAHCSQQMLRHITHASFAITSAEATCGLEQFVWSLLVEDVEARVT